MCPFWVARTYSCEGALPRIPVYGPAQSLAEAAGTFSGPVSLATPGQVLDLG